MRGVPSPPSSELSDSWFHLFHLKLRVLLVDKQHFSLRTAPIHAEAPEFTDMSVEQEILVTGIKVVDLLAPYAKGGKIGMCSCRCLLPECKFAVWLRFALILLVSSLQVCSVVLV